MAEARSGFIDYEFSEGVATLTLRRPPANVLNIATLRELQTAVESASSENDLKVLVLAAEGKHFCAGVDVADHTPERVGEMIPLFDEVCLSLARFPLPTLAIIQGHALGGGCELVISCDFAWMARGARIGQPEIQLGVLAPVAALRLASLVGPRWAARLLFTGESLEADQAEKIGLVDGVVALDELPGVVQDFVDRLRQHSAAALRYNKAGFLLGTEKWAAGIPAIERLYLDDLMQTEDAQEGLRAFMEKRAPNWKDR